MKVPWKDTISYIANKMLEYFFSKELTIQIIKPNNKNGKILPDLEKICNHYFKGHMLTLCSQPRKLYQVTVQFLHYWFPLMH